MDKLHGSLQENIITLLCHDDDYGKIVVNAIDVNLLEGDYRVVAEKAIDFWKLNSEAPKAHTVDLFGDILGDEGNRKAATYRRILAQMGELAQVVNAKYVVSQIERFMRMQRYKAAILESAEKLQNNELMALDEIEELWHELLAQREYKFEKGMGLIELDRIMEYMAKHHREFFTGISAFDHNSIVPARGEVMLFLAAVGKGKSWWLIHIAKLAALQRKRVLHISLEMSEELVGLRYIQAMMSIAKRPGELETTRLVVDGDDDNPQQKLVDLKRETIEPDMTLISSADAISTNTESLMKWHPKKFGNVLIKRFPPRALSVSGLRSYLDTLEASDGFVPDILVLDYIGIMNTDAKNHRISLGRVMEDFRAVCVERNIAGVTAHQVQREGALAKNVRATHVAEDWSLIATADIAITYSQTPAEKKLGLARLYVDKARNDKDQFGVLITQQYGVGQFVLESLRLRSDYPSLLKDFADDVLGRGKSRRGEDEGEEDEIEE